MCGHASGWSKGAFAALLVGVVIHITGWATNSWMVFETSNGFVKNEIGLWREQRCFKDACTEGTLSSDFETEMFQVVRGLETVTFCLGVFTLVLLLVYLCAIINQKQRVAGAIMVLCYLSGICSFVGMIMFVMTLAEAYVISWSFGLTVLGMILIFIAGTLMVPDAFEPEYGDFEYADDDYFATARRRDMVSPMSMGSPRGGGAKVISWHGNGGDGGSRWRSY